MSGSVKKELDQRLVPKGQSAGMDQGPGLSVGLDENSEVWQNDAMINWYIWGEHTTIQENILVFKEATNDNINSLCFPIKKY